LLIDSSAALQRKRKKAKAKERGGPVKQQVQVGNITIGRYNIERV